jgi:hypothetical protein
MERRKMENGVMEGGHLKRGLSVLTAVKEVSSDNTHV